MTIGDWKHNFDLTQLRWNMMIFFSFDSSTTVVAGKQAGGGLLIMSFIFFLPSSSSLISQEKLSCWGGATSYAVKVSLSFIVRPRTMYRLC